MSIIGIALVAMAYLVGSVQTGVIYSRLRGADIRGQDAPGGSGIYRTYGLKPAILVTVLDMAKGALVAFVALNLEPAALPWAILAVVLGHNYPIFFGFNGGAGIAPGYGTLLVARSWDALSLLVLLIVVGAVYKYTLQRWLGIFVIPFASFVSLAIMLTINYVKGQGFIEMLVFTLAMTVRSVQLLLQKPSEN
jgi:acyl phosphate:glycerol-3-phosphate acyltransferase